MIKKFTPALAGLATLAGVSLENEKNEFHFQALVDELQSLNQRWQKACDLERLGKFDALTSDQEERICSELRQIISRATEIWETLATEAPESLKHVYYLEP